MKDIRRILVSVFVMGLFGFVLFLHTGFPESISSDIGTYYIHNFTADTGAFNAVAAIYLNYRMYDTVFEALILLVSIIAMLHFFKVGGHG